MRVQCKQSGLSVHHLAVAIPAQFAVNHQAARVYLMKALLTVDGHGTIHLSSEVGPSFNELLLLRLPLAGLLVPMLAGPARPFRVMSYSTKKK